MLNEVQRLTELTDLVGDSINNKDLNKNVYRCDLDKPCVQYCVSDPSHCGVLVKGVLDKLDKEKK